MSRIVGFLMAATVLVPSAAFAASGTFTLEPLSAVSPVGDTFDVEVVVDSGGKAVNAIEAELAFNTAVLAVVGISTERSAFGTWPTQPEYSNIDGTIHFAGWANVPFVAGRERVLTITFRGLSAAQSPLRFTSGALLSPEGQETNILSLMESGVYRIETRIVSAPAPAAPTADEAVVLPTVPAQGSGLAAPTMPPGADLALGDRIIIKGTSEPSAKIVLWTQYESEQEVRSELYSTLDGTFTYVSEELERPGTYRVWAALENGSGVRGVSSSVQTYVVAPHSVQTAAVAGAGIGWAALPYFIMLAGLAFLFVYATRARSTE